MNNIFKILQSHRSIRKYKEKPVPDDLLNNILNSARQAPTSSNIQAYSVIVVRDQDKKKQLARFAGDQPWVKQCAVFLVICPDLLRLDKMCKSRNYVSNDQHTEMFIVAVVDAALVAQNILVASEASGLGTCMIGGIRNNPDDVCKLLNVPDKVFPLMGICLGWPDHDPMIKPRLQPEMIIHNEVYDDSNFDQLLDEYDSIMQSTGLYDGPRRKAQAPDGREVPDDDYSWSEHTARRMASTDPGTLRAHMKKFLLDKGFGLE